MSRGQTSKLDVLRKVPLFASCTDAELGEIALAADELALPAGAELTKQGAVGREFVIVMDGDVEVHRDGEKVDAASGHNFYGEMALLHGEPRNATVMTASSVRALVLTHAAFHRLLESSPELAAKIERTAAERSS